MEKYNISGMSCAACSSRVEKVVSNMPGVTSCSVSLLTNSMEVEGNVTPKEVIKAVKSAGYGAKLNSNEGLLESADYTSNIKKRLIASSIFLIILMYISMGYTMFNFPVFKFLINNPLIIAVLQMIFALVVMIINKNFFISGFKAVIKKAPNMDTLVALGSMASYVYSLIVVFLMNTSKEALLDDLYFDASAMILTLISLGKLLEARAKGKTTDALKSLMKLSPKNACVIIS